jgi:hypothetical protein
MSDPRHKYVIIPMVEANGHTESRQVSRILCGTEKQAVATAESILDKRTYNSMFIYKACIQVRRSAPPIEIIHLDED